MNMRKEHDFVGEMQIPGDVYYGIQTYRAVENFKISGHTLQEYPYFIKALAQLKAAAALANEKLGVLSTEKAQAIVVACEEIIKGKYFNQFVVDMIQGGAGTSTNMNMNEVIANIALEKLGYNKGEYEHLHPNDHVNLGQSTNDVYPSGIKVATYGKLVDVLKAMSYLVNKLNIKAEEFKDILKMGRTEMEDAVPTTLGNTFKAFANYLVSSEGQVKMAMDTMTHLNMGATAIGTGINCHPQYKYVVEEELQKLTGVNFEPAKDLIAATQDTADFVFVSGAIKTVAVRLNKIANDLRLMNSGPRCGLSEINLPKMQPGSSIMPGKVNPVIPEVVTEACFEIMGNDLNITLCAQRGEFELNPFEPGIAYGLFNSLTLLENALYTLADKAIEKLTANPKACQQAIFHSISIVTALNPYIGYEKSSSIAKEALETGRNIQEICIERGYLTEAELKKILEPETMLKPQMEVKKV